MYLAHLPQPRDTTEVLPSVRQPAHLPSHESTQVNGHFNKAVRTIRSNSFLFGNKLGSCVVFREQESSLTDQNGLITWVKRRVSAVKGSFCSFKSSYFLGNVPKKSNADSKTCAGLNVPENDKVSVDHAYEIGFLKSFMESIVDQPNGVTCSNANAPFFDTGNYADNRYSQFLVPSPAILILTSLPCLNG